jgi:hypothetical protein
MKRYQWRLARHRIGGAIAGIGIGATLMVCLSELGITIDKLARILVLIASLLAMTSGVLIANMSFNRGDVRRLIGFLVAAWAFLGFLAYAVWRMGQS